MFGKGKSLKDSRLETLDNLNLRNMVQLSMDGPAVNWRLYKDVVKDCQGSHHPDLIGTYILNIVRFNVVQRQLNGV